MSTTLKKLLAPKRREILAETLEDRILYSAAPQVAVTVNPGGAPSVQIGESVPVKVSFVNASPTDTGFGPFVDVAIDHTGHDGATPNPATPTVPGPFDGLSLTTPPTYLGAALNYSLLTLDDSANGGKGVIHPYATTNTGGPVYVSTTDPTSPYYSMLNGSFQDGDQLLVVELPFGSFTPNQPAADINFGLTLSNLADVGQPLTIKADGGFRYGNDPLNNPASDPTIIGTPSAVTANVDATLATLTKTYIGPENETATGPNYLRTYRIQADIAAGQTLQDMNLFDNIPSNEQFVGISGSNHAYTIVGSAPSTTTPGGNLQVQLTGASTGSVYIDVQFYVPRTDASSSSVLNPSTGAPVIITNQSYGYANWTPLDPRDPLTRVGLEATVDPVTTNPANPVPTAADNPAREMIEAQSLVVQKGFINLTRGGNDANAIQPGDVLVFTLDFQVSDYYAFQNLLINDTQTDGLHFDPGFTPTLTINGNQYAYGQTNFLAANYTVDLTHIGNDTNPATDGSTVLQFRISDQVISQGQATGRIIGGGIDPAAPTGVIPNPLGYNDGATTGQIIYQARVLDKYTDTYPSGEPSLDPRDTVTNSAITQGAVLTLAPGFAPTGSIATDDTGVTLKIAVDQVQKSIYAINGNTNLSLFTDSLGRVNVSAGDTVTYRLQYTLPSGDVEQLRFTDYLPLPVYSATQVVGPFNTTPSATAPAAGAAGFGPLNTLQTATSPGPAPTITTNATANSVKFTLGDTINTTNNTLAIDILFTVTVQTNPFADGLYLTNQVQSGEQNTQNPGVENEATTNAIVQIVLDEPVVSINKGVVAATTLTAPVAVGGLTFANIMGNGFAGTLVGGANATAIGALNLNNPANAPDAGDLVRYALVVQNTGRADAFGVTFKDKVLGSYVNNYADAAAFTAGTNLKVYSGAGALLVLGTDYTLTWDTTTKEFAITLTDSSSTSGKLDRGFIAETGTQATTGANSVIVTYDLTVDTDALASSTITNTATLTNYQNKPGGGNFVPAGATDTADVAIHQPDFKLLFLNTSVNTSGNNNAQATIGETALYQMVVTVPEGTTDAASILNTLAPGLKFLDIVAVTTSPGVSTQNTIGTGSFPSNVSFGSTGGGTNNQLTFNFGNITNTNTDNSVPETITITYRAYVDNTNAVPASPGNQAGTVLGDTATLTYNYQNDPTTGTLAGTPINSTAANVTVIEPGLTILKEVSKDNVTYQNTPTLGGFDAGDTVFYRITITNPSGGPTAFDTLLNDTLPTALGSATLVSVSGGGFTTSDFQITGNVLQTSSGGGIDVAGGTTITIIVSAPLLLSVNPTQVINNNSTVTWTSLNGLDPNERTGAGGPGTDAAVLNNYFASSQTSNSIINPLPQKAVITTSEAPTGDLTNVQIGEIVRYQLVWQIPEGTTPDLSFLDNLPGGLQFINDGTATVAFASNQTGITSTGTNAVTNPTAFLTTLNSVPVMGSVVAQLQGGQVTTGTNSVTFHLGDVQNADSDTDAEYVVVDFNALVLNTVGNQAGTPLDNTFNVFTGASSLNQSNTAEVIVREPNVGITKSVVATTGDAGDTVTYTVNLTNTGATATNAFNIHVQDNLPAALVGLNLGSVSVALGGGATGVTDTSAGNNVVLDIDSLPVNGTISITYTATLLATIPAGQIITNTANATYTSLPGTAGSGLPVTVNDGTTTSTHTSTVTGTPGTSTGERTGADGIGGALNDYALKASATVTVNQPTVDLQWKDGSLTADDTSVTTSTGNNLVIGEMGTFDILVTLPEGVTRNLAIKDILPPGYSLDSYQILTAAGSSALLTNSFNGTVTTTPTQSGTGTVLFSFGDTTTTNDNVANNNSFVIRVVGTLQNVIGNQQNVTLNTDAKLDYTNPNNATTTEINDLNSGNNPQLVVKEPTVTINKTVAGPAAPDAGDTLTYTVTLSNTSGQEAYEVTFFDQISSLLTNAILTSVATTGTGTPATLADFTIAGSTLTTSAGADLDLPTGGTITLTYTAQVAGTVVPGSTITNVANDKWSSINGTPTVERDGSGILVDATHNAPSTINQTTPAGGVLNDYALSSSVITTTTGGIVISKAIVTTDLGGNDGQVTPGEIVTYQVTVTLPEGSSPNLQVLDALPAGMAYIPGSASVDTTGYGGTLGALTVTPNGSPTFTDGADMLFNFGATTTNGDNVTTNNSFTFSYQAVVLDVASNVGTIVQTTLPNTAQANAGTTGSPFGASTPPVTVTVVEPKLVLTSSIVVNGAGTGPGDAGDPFTYTVNVKHNGGADPGPDSTSTAYDVDLTDVVPTGLTPTSFTVFQTGVGNISANFQLIGNTLSKLPASTINLDPTQQITVTINGTFSSAVTPNTTYTNNSTLNYSSYPGDRTPPTFNPSNDVTTDHERLSNATSAVATSTPIGSITKTLMTTSSGATTGSNVTIGETVTYALTVRLPEGTTPSLVVQDILPPGLQYLSSTVDTSNFNGTVPAPTISGGAASGDDVTYNFGTVSVTGDNVTTNNSFVIFVTARVTNEAVNDGGHSLPTPVVAGNTLPNSASMTIPTFQTITTTPVVNVQVVEPKLEINKSFGITAGNAGDVVPVTVTIRNDGTSPAFDTVISDILDNNVFDLSTYSASAPAGWTVSGVDPTTHQVLFTDTNAGGLAVGATATFTYNITLKQTLAPGAQISNTAQAVTTTLPGVDPNERTEPIVSSTATLQATASVTLAKTLIGTSEGSTATDNLAIGEVGTFQLKATIQEGTTATVTFTDTIPTGLSYVAGTAVFRAVTTGATAVGFNSNLAYADGSFINAADLDFTGGVLTVRLKNVTIPATAANNTGDFAVEYGARAVNIPANIGNPTTTLTNSARVAADLNNDGDTADPGETTATSSVPVHIVEPLLTLTKDITPANADAGDAVPITLSVHNTGTAAAFDTVLTDQLPANFDPTTIASIVAPSGWTSSVVGQNLIFTDTNASGLAVNGTANFSFTVKLKDNTNPGITITNTSTVVTTTLPGVDPTERTEPTVNASDTVAVPNPVTIAKTVISTTDTVNTTGNNLGIGESATFQVAATMEQGLTKVVTFKDVIPTGLTFQNAVVFRATTPGATAVGANTNTVYNVDGMAIAAGDITYAGGVLTVALKNVQIPATTATTTGTIAIEYSAQVADIPANVDGHTLTNSATVAADRNADGDNADPGETTSPAAQTLTVVEPHLTILKSFGAASRDAGDTIPVTITITNTGGGRAFDTVLTDTLNPAYFDLTSVTGITAPSGWTGTYTPGTGAFLLQDTNATGLAPTTGTATFTFNVNLRSDLAPGTAVSNTATTHTTTQPGVVVGERTEPDVSSTANLTTLSSLTFTKALFNTSIGNDISTTVSVGEVNTYRLTTTLQQGLTDVVTVNDSLPATQLVYQAGTAIFHSAAGVTAYGANSNTFYADGNTILPADITYVPGTGALQFALKNVQVPVNTIVGTGAFSIDYQALVADVPANTGGATLTNTAVAHADRNGDGDATDPGETSTPASQTVTIQTPALTIDKSFDVATGDAGNVVTSTIIITNSGNGVAYDTNLSDTIDGNVFALGSFSLTTFPAGWTGNYNPATGLLSYTDGSAAGLAAGASVTFTFTTTLRADLAPGAAVSNTASAFTTTAPGTPTGDRTTPTVSDSAALTVPAPLTFAKAIAGTSLPDTTGNTVAIGEHVIYTLTTGLEQGVTKIVNVNDVLPAGLVYQGGSAAFLAASGVTAVGATSGTTYTSGMTILASDLTYNAGTGAFQVRLVNVTIPTTTANGTGSFTIVYNALVANVPGNSGGVTLTNAASVDADRNADGDNVDSGEHATGSQTITILEPDLAITKTFNVTTGDAGDPVQVTLTVKNNGNGTGYDSLVKDLLDPTLFDIGSFTAVTTPAGWTPTYDNTTGALQYLNTSAAGIASGATVTFVFTVNLATALPPGTTVTNTATIDTTTLPGTDANERQEPTHNSTAIIAGDSSIGFGKSLVSTSSASTTGTDVAIGETANYQLLVTLQEGVTKTVTLSDVLPAGPTGTLLYQSGTATFHATTAGATAVGAVSNTVYADGSVIDAADISYTSSTGALIISLKNVFIPATGTSGTGSFAVTYTALAVDQPENASGTALTNTASVAADLNGNGTSTDPGENQSAPPVTINVIEPLIAVTKTFGVATANAGDTIPVTLTVTNNGTATAWDTVLTDTISNAFFDRTSFTLTGLPAGWISNYSSTTGVLTLTNTDPAGLAVGATATFTFNIDLQNALPPGATVTNTVFGVTTTLPGTDANERTEPVVQDTATLNASTSLTMTKTLDSTSLPDSATATTPEIAIGETAIYRLTITLGEGVTGLATFNDSLPPGLSYQAGTAIFRATTAGSTADGAVSGTHYVDGSVIQASDITYNAATGALSFAFKNVTIPSSGTTGTGQFAVTYSVIADNILSNQDTVVLTNGATASADLNDDGDTADVGETSATQSVSVEIVEPVLSLTQTSQFVEPGGPRLGEPVTYTITLTNTGTSTAYDTSWLSQLPSGVTATSISSVTLAGGATTDTAAAVHAGTNTVDGQFDIPVGGTVTIVFVGTASTNPADLGVTFTTTSTASYTSLPGGNTAAPDAGERTGADGPGPDATTLNNYAVGASDGLVIVAADLTVTKDDGLTTVVPGQTYTYNINVTNKATATATGEGLLLTDTLMPDAVLGLVQVNGVTVTPTISGSNFTIALADLAIGDSATITVTVTLKSVVSATTESLTNTATIGQSGIDPTPEDNTASDTDVVDAEPDLVVTKTPSVTSARAGDNISYNITVTNVGNQDAPLSTLTDTLDTNIVSFVSTTLGGTYAGGIVNWNLGTIAGGGGVATTSVVVQIANPLPAGVTQINNTVHTTFDEASVGADPTPLNNTAMATVSLPGTPDMRIVKTASTSQVSLNSQFSYTLTVTNVGQQNATGVTVTDTLPAGLSFVAADNGGVYNATTRQITWTIPGTFLGNGRETVQLHTTVVVAPGADVSGGVSNTGRVADDGTNGADPHPEDNTSTVTIPAIGAGLNVTKTDGLTTVVPGQTVTYTMVVNNPGTGTATQVVFTDTLPPGATLGVVKVGDVVVTPTLTSTGFTLSLADIPSGGSRTITAQVTMPTHAAVGQESVTNTVTVTHSVTDPTPGDNTATDTDTLNARPDLVVTKTPSVTATQQGGTISYTITVTNVGNQDASDVTLTDQLETALVDFLSASLGGTLNNGVVSWNLGTIAGAGGSATVTVNVVAHNPLTPGTQIGNTVVGKFNETTDGPDPTPTNNQDTATVVIEAPLVTPPAPPTGPVAPGQTAPDLVIVKTNSADIIGLGLNFTYTLSVTNIGTAPATGVTVVDYLPANLTFISADNGGVYNAITRQITWVLPGTLPGGSLQTINLHVNAQLSPNVGLSSNGPLTNIATVTNDGRNGPEITLRNNTSLVVTPVQLFSYNAFRNFATWSPFGTFHIPDDGWWHPTDTPYRAPMLTTTPMYSGAADPGSTLVVAIFNALGAQVGTQTVVVDAGGNWLATFPSTVLHDYPQTVTITERPAPLDNPDHSGFNLRTYFSPAINSSHFFYQDADVNKVLAESPANVVESMYEGARNPVRTSGEKYRYEMISSQGTPAGY